MVECGLDQSLVGFEVQNWYNPVLLPGLHMKVVVWVGTGPPSPGPPSSLPLATLTCNAASSAIVPPAAPHFRAAPTPPPLSAACSAQTGG